jgi:DNA polymerase III delta prime subunit
MKLYDNLWVQKYAPKTLNELVLSEENRDFFSKINEDTPHLLLYGKAGTGKTSLAKIIVKDVLKCQYIYINSSDENGIDTIRNKVTNFSQTRSLDGKKKVIILDEFCGTTPEAQRMLRNTMEEYASTTRFILTANYIKKIIEPIQSRCLLFDIVPNLEQSVLRCFTILKQENIKIESEESTIRFIKSNFPDLRRIINDLQKFSITGNLVIESDKKIKNYANEVLNFLKNKKDLTTIRTFLIQEERNFASDYQLIMKELFDLVYESNLKDDIKRAIMLEIGEHIYRDNFVVDHEINCFCCIMNISKYF